MRNKKIYKLLYMCLLFSIVSILVINFLWKDLANALFWTGALIAGIGVIYINPSNKIVPRQGDINMSSDDYQVINQSSGPGDGISNEDKWFVVKERYLSSGVLLAYGLVLISISMYIFSNTK